MEESKSSMDYRSPQINELMTAFSIAQGMYKKLIPTSQAAGGAFASLHDIICCTRDALSTNGLAFYQHIELLDEGSGASLLITCLAHSSGQYIASKARIVAGKTDRQTGNSLEIQKRLQALLILGVAPSANDPIAFDDNGMIQTEEHTLEQLKKPKAEREIDKTETISKAQYEDILIELNAYPEIARGILDSYAIDSLADIPKSEYHPVMRQIRKLVKNFEEYRK